MSEDRTLPGALPGAPQTPHRAGVWSMLMRYFARFDDGEVMRWAFRGLLVGAIGVLAMDLRDMALDPTRAEPDTPALAVPDEPILPPAVETTGPASDSADPRRNVRTDEDALRQPMIFTLEAGNVLAARGSIDVGAAVRFVAELEARGEYVRTVSLNSPGGSLEDALAMSTAIRDRGLDTGVASGAICASSCPLILAGGKARVVDAEAAVGVHQFYAIGENRPGADQAMSDAQATTARISRHLSTMGVDPALWLHALDTPPRQLYYFKPTELTRYRLATETSAVAAEASR